MKLSSARTILPVLMLVCVFSLVIRGMEVWSGVKSMGGSAFALESSDVEPPEEMPNSISQETQMQEDIGEPPALEISEDDTGSTDTTDEVIEQLEGFDEVTPIQAELAQDLVKQRKRLEAREAQLFQKEALLQAAEQELDRKYQEPYLSKDKEML